MDSIKPQSKGTKRLFKNPILEKLTRTHIAVPVVTFLLYSSGLMYWSVIHTLLSAGTTVGMFFIGILTFTWVEYIVHRYIFHMSTRTEKRTKMQYTMHGVHHEYPKDKERLAMPPLLSITISTGLLFLLRIIMGDFVFSFLPGFLAGYAYYLCIHYMVHTFQPPKNFLKILWINHSMHHYKQGAEIFGVSSPLWDYVYGTIGKK